MRWDEKKVALKVLTNDVYFAWLDSLISILTEVVFSTDIPTSHIMANK